MTTIQNESTVAYTAGPIVPADLSSMNAARLTNLCDENALLEAAAIIYQQRAKELSGHEKLTSPTAARRAIETAIAYSAATKQHEVFGVVYLDNRHRIIDNEELFRGTIDGTAVYPREVAKAALAHNAAAVIFWHNHPGGEAEPSKADRDTTDRLTKALGTLDIWVLDHLVVGLGNTVSFAERGWI